MEIWGGNRAIETSFEAPGLDIYVHSQPFQNSEAGGDIYYLTSCASGRVSRFLLADVSGHGDSAAGIAKSLRDSLRQNVNKISQESFVAEMNREFRHLAKRSAFATAVVATFFAPRKTLDISVAGHPNPLYYRAESQKWVCLNPAETEANFENMPLGIVKETTYPRRKVKTEFGDMFLLYSDAFIESAVDGKDNSQLGIEGVLELLNGNPCVAPAEVIPFLRGRIGKMATGNLLNDDASLILGHFTETKTSMRDNLMAPIRLFRNASDRTHFS